MASDPKAGADEIAPAVGQALSRREAAVLEYVIDYLTEHGYQPSLREICEACRCKSTKTMSELIQALAEKGYVQLPDSGSRPARAIRLLCARVSIERTMVPPGRRRRAARDSANADE